MKAMLSGFALIIAIAVGADLALDNAGFSSQDRHSGPNVRVD